MQGEEQILQRFDAATAALKTWRGGGDWRISRLAGGVVRLDRILGLAIDGEAKSGLQARLVCRADLFEKDVYGQLEMHIPEVPCYGHFQRVSWRPLRQHTNGGRAPQALRFQTYTDRQEIFHHNRHLGIAGLRQLVPSIAQPLAPLPANFQGLLRFLEEFWGIDSLDDVADPPWENRLL